MPQYIEVPGHGVVEFPDGMSDDQIASAIKANMSPQQSAPQEESSFLGNAAQGVGNLAAGAVRGAGSIGATILAPFDMAKDAIAGKGLSLESNRQRRADIDAGLQTLGADPESLLYKGGKLAGEIAGTAGAGGVLAKGAQAVPALTRAVPSLVPALQSGGFKIGQEATTKSGMLANALLRTGAGGATGATMAGMVNPEDAGTGAILGAAMPGAFKLAGEAGIAVNKVGKAMARRLMQSALKPTIKQLKTGDARVAVDTLLDLGINPNAKGVEKMRGMVDDINTAIADKLKGSNATVSRQSVLDYLGGVREKFGSQVNPLDDLGAIQKVGDEFVAHPYFKSVEAQGPALEAALKTASQGKAQALQAAGKLKTFAAQQQNLAHGGGVKLAPVQPQNQLYMNTGATGRNAVSPAAYPTPLAPRMPGRYTPNIDRVPEGLSGYDDAMAAYARRKADEQAAQKALEQWQSSRGAMPVQVAQKLKQGTYKSLAGKYGEVGSASTEAQKALARGLKDQIAEAVPGIGQLNAQEAALLKTLDVAERRALMEMNKNPAGLSMLAGNKAAFAAFMADRSAAFKGLASRMINRAAEAPSVVNPLADKLANPALRGGMLAIGASQGGQQ